MNKITKQNGTLLVPDKVVIPFIEGDGVGAEITPVCQRIVDEAVGRAYGGQRVIEWKEVLAGLQADRQLVARRDDGGFPRIYDRDQRPADNAYRRWHPFVERRTQADPRPLCLPPSGTLVPWSCDTCQRAGKS